MFKASASIASVLTPPLAYREEHTKGITYAPPARAHTHMDPPPHLKHSQCSHRPTMNHSHRTPLWCIHWPEIEPTLIRYQEAVTLDRVLSEHRAAVGAEPMETSRRTRTN